MKFRIITLLCLMLIVLSTKSQSIVKLSCDFQLGNTKCQYTPSSFDNYDDLKNWCNWNTCAEILSDFIPAGNFNFSKNYFSPDYFSQSCANAERIFGTGSGIIRLPMDNDTSNKFIGLTGGKYDWQEGIIINIPNGLSHNRWKYYELHHKGTYSDTNSYWNGGSNHYYDPVTKKHKLRISFSKYNENWKDNGNQFWENNTEEFISGLNV